MLKLDRSSKHGLLCFGDNTFLSYYHDLPVNINNGFVISQPETSLPSLPASAKPMTLESFHDRRRHNHRRRLWQRPTATASTTVAQPRPAAESQAQSLADARRKTSPKYRCEKYSASQRYLGTGAGVGPATLESYANTGIP